MVDIGCLCKALFKRGVCDTFANRKDLKSEWLSSPSVRKECLPRKFLESLWKASPSYSTVKKWAKEFKRGDKSLRMMDGLGA